MIDSAKPYIYLLSVSETKEISFQINGCTEINSVLVNGIPLLIKESYCNNNRDGFEQTVFKVQAESDIEIEAIVD